MCCNNYDEGGRYDGESKDIGMSGSRCRKNEVFELHPIEYKRGQGRLKWRWINES